MKKPSILVWLLITLALVACDNRRLMRSRATNVSISSDGRYVVSVHAGYYLVLWDLKNKTKKILNQNTRYYTAHFIKHSHTYVWQTKDNVLHFHDMDNKVEQTIPLDFPVFGMVDTKNGLVVSDELWRLYLVKNNEVIMFKNGNSGVESNGKLLTMSSDDKGKYLLTSGVGFIGGESVSLEKGHMASDIDPKKSGRHDFSLLDGVVLWDMSTLKPIKKLLGYRYMTVSAINNTGRYMVAGDENTRLYTWNLRTGKKIYGYYDLWSGKRLALCEDRTYCNWDDTGLIKLPKDFKRCYTPQSCVDKSSINALKFIAKDQYLRFTTGVPYAILYDLLDPKPKKYFSLRTKPKTFTNTYLAEPTIDTAPEAGILVMTQTGNPDPNDQKGVNYFGINVFKYDRAKQTLKLIWSPKGPPAYREPKQKTHDEKW